MRTEAGDNGTAIRREMLREPPPQSGAHWKQLKGRAFRAAPPGVKGDTATEILDGELQPGDVVIVRANEAPTPEK